MLVSNGLLSFVCFSDEPEKRHVFAARAEDNVVQWVMKLRESSYEYLRNRLHALQSRIYAITGKVKYDHKCYLLCNIMINDIFPYPHTDY